MEVKSKTIELQGEKYLFRPNFRCLLEYEKISGNGVGDIKTLNDSTMFLYCGVKAGMIFDKKKFEMTYDEFIDKLDDIDVLEVLSDDTPKKEKKNTKEN